MRRAGDKFREVTSSTDWPGYNGDPGGNRYTTLAQITKANVARLGPKWVFTLPNAARLQVTPVVVGGIMYVSVANECYALDAGTGREIWHYRRPPTAGLPSAAVGGTNRGVATAGDRVFMSTDHAHLIALNRFTGELVWDTEMADWHLNYFSTSAPLAVGNLVVAGTGGGEHGARGFLAAFDQATGKEAWRFWTVPKPGEPASDTWQGKGIEHPGAPTWFTGTYDSQLDTVYWPTGNPSAEYNGDDRLGDNLYSDCILALDAKTGKLKWHYQTTPHDLWDWDATETPVVLDTAWEGQAAQTADPGQSQRVLLRLRPHRRQAAAGQTIRHQPELGQRHRRRRAPRQAPQHGAKRRGNQGVPLAGRRHQLVLAVLQSRHRLVLCADLREVQRVHQARSGGMDSRARNTWAGHSAGRRAKSRRGF